MKKLLLASAASMALAGAASAEEVKLGFLSGFTGPLESIAPAMVAGAELAAKEINDSGRFTAGTLVVVRGDDTCGDAAAGVVAAERLVTSDGVKGIVGGSCSGVTGAILQNVAVPNGIGMISPSATSPALSTAEDNGLFFRTAPSDARQGAVMTDIINERGFKTVALTYTNNDYGKGLADSFQTAFEATGGTVTISVPHEDGKADYASEVAALASAGGEILVVAGYTDQGGKGIIRASLDTGAFSTFVLPDGMVGQQIATDLGSGLNTSFGQYPGSDSKGSEIFQGLATAAGFDGTSAFSPESYDALALMVLSMAAAGSTESKDWTAKVMDIANAPGEPILPGELGKALDLIAAGTDIDYVGASAVELIGAGESAGNYREVEFKDGEIITVRFR
jgi:branched-chain amino acid transport system substrate-binding protein